MLTGNSMITFKLFQRFGNKIKIKHYTTRSNQFKGLDGFSPCTVLSVPGPEPEYDLKLSKKNTFQIFKYDKPFTMYQDDGKLPEFQLAYETWGELNETKDNAILLFTGLSATSHAKSNQNNLKNGWWEEFIGPKCAIDTEKFFVICCNHLGSCFGSTGPSSINPITHTKYATTFPIVTIYDMIRVQFKLLDHLGIKKLNASIGSSLGGMCSLLTGLEFSDRVSKIISISSCTHPDPNQIALRYLQRKAIMSDPSWNNGFYYDSEYPVNGIRLAREIATLSYRSGPEWNIRFGRTKMNELEPVTLCPTFQIENYLNHQGEIFANKYDPNSLIYLSKAVDLFNLSEGYSSLNEALSKITCPTLIMGSQTDILFPVEKQRALAKGLRSNGNNAVTYFEMDSLYGHDTFLLNLNDVGTAMKGFLETKLPKTGDLHKMK